MVDLSFLNSQACSTIVAAFSSIIAFLALVLSQLPPLRVLIKGVKIKIVAEDKIKLTHFLGSVSLVFFLNIYNAGGRSVSISKIDCVIKNDNCLLLHLPPQGYYSRQPPSQANQQIQEYFIGLIPLKAGEAWGETVHCFSPWTQEEEEHVNDIILKIKNSIAKNKNEYKKNVPTVADESSVNEAINEFERKFNLEKDEYHLLIAVFSESNEILAVTGYSFKLYDNHIQTLKAYTKRYKYGVYLPSSDPIMAVWPRLTPITDELAKKEYRKLFDR